MNQQQVSTDSDIWSEWLLHRRHADDNSYADIVRREVLRYADRVLDGAQLKAGMTVADIGSGDGLVAFRAIERIGPLLNVILTDVSKPLLDHAERAARELGIWNQCRFVECSAECLQSIDTDSVDVVVTRAALAYVHNKETALHEIHRVLKPGGRISLAEPIFQDEAFATCALRLMLEKGLAKSDDAFLPLLHRCKSAQYPDTPEALARSPFANFSERDLARLAQAAGFVYLHMEFHVDVQPSTLTSWEVFLDTSPHPLAPPLRSVLKDQFTPEERGLFEAIMRHTVETGRLVSTNRMAYLTALKEAYPAV